jgi:DNA-binding helix-hairpin-helix protein with protein kinase domain
MRIPPVASPRRPADTMVRIEWPDGRSERAGLIALGKSGGAGEVFGIEGRPEFVAKIYHAATRSDQLAQYGRKTAWMIRNRPDLPKVPGEYSHIVQLAWPIAQVTRGSDFAGFLMDKIDFARTMELDFLLSHRQAAGQGFEADLGKLVTVCCNLATLLDCLHARRIAVVDLKPINIKIYKSELYVSILDCDGFHIYSDTFVSRATQVTPEYLAPEYHDRLVTQPEAQDGFALATVIFRLLNYGIHPFAGIPVGRNPYPSELAGRIRQGLYPYGRLPNPRVRAAPASVHECLPAALRELFDRAFEQRTFDRPRAGEWAAVLRSFASRGEGRLERCPRSHLHFAGMRCPACLREGILQFHGERHRRLATRIRTSPARAVTYVRRAIRGTQSSPFQAALAQVQLHAVQLAPVSMPIRNVVSIEILWTFGILVTWWWLR